jgi:hypothetical protein
MKGQIEKRHDCCCCCCESNEEREFNEQAPEVPQRMKLMKWFPPTEGLDGNIFSPFSEVDSDEETVAAGKTLVTLASKTPVTTVPNLGISCVNAMSTATTAAGYRHDPDGIFWLPGPWPTWDGISVVNPCTSTKEQIAEFVWPGGGWKMRGLRAEFYSSPPFANNNAPTVKEIEDWHVRVIMLYRRLLGKTNVVQSSRTMYLNSQWNDERKWSTVWDSTYPGTLGDAFGPCVGMNPFNQHCGATFVPTCPDQLPKLDVGEPCTVSVAGAEGIFGGEMDWPWAIKLSRVLQLIVQAEGITGHGGPFVSRPEVGMSFRCEPGTQLFTVRIKWTGSQTAPC